ncbi:MAG: hypothetical protein KF833_22380 [Verrucomicrobiae bacterium]|nr:hypothetical protein [Verrucomicrobiae bacterium]
MSIVAIVEKDTIRLPPGVHLPDGTMVRVELEGESVGNSLAWLGAFAGTVEGPKDLAAEHDHCAHGAPKRPEP